MKLLDDNTEALGLIEVNAEDSKQSSEEALFSAYISAPSRDKRNEIVNKYTYIAEILSKKFLNRGVDYEDIFQVACIALIKAVERFDLEKGVKFVTFATPTIIGEIKRFFRDKASLIRIPRRIYEVYQKVSHAREYLTQQLHRPPRIEEIAAYTGMDEEEVLEIIESNNTHSIKSFDQSISADEDIELQDTIGQEDIEFVKVENRDFLEKSLEKFSEAEKEFINQRFFKNKTQKEIAEQLKVSQMYVSRLEKKVLDKFRLFLNKR